VKAGAEVYSKVWASPNGS